MRKTLDKRPIIIRRTQEISVTLRSVPTIVTAHTFCAFRDFPRGTRDARVNFYLLSQCSFATSAFALSRYTGSNDS